MESTQAYLTIKEVLAENNFSDFIWVDCRPSIADLFKPQKRCGIYVLYFNNDESYVGQAVDVIRRYVQHSKNHKDIQEIAFKEVKGPDLNHVEAQTIKTLEQRKIRLRNISLTSLPKGETDLDLLIPKTEQSNWLNSSVTNKLGEYILNEPVLQSRYTRKFNQLVESEYFIKDVLPFLREYYKKCVIKSPLTELSFWSISVLPGDSQYVHCRLNLFWSEVLTIYTQRMRIIESKDFQFIKETEKSILVVIDEEEIYLPKNYAYIKEGTLKISEYAPQLYNIKAGQKGDGDISFSLHITKEGITKSNIKEFRKEIPTLKSTDHYYAKGGFDQFQIIVNSSEDAMKLLENEKILMAIKTFNLRQMQKGATVYGKSHCIDLAKLILTNPTKTQI